MDGYPLYIPERNRAGLIYWRFNLQHKFIRRIFYFFVLSSGLFFLTAVVRLDGIVFVILPRSKLIIPRRFIFKPAEAKSRL